jgi:hypothetical protein
MDGAKETACRFRYLLVGIVTFCYSMQCGVSP